MIIFPAIDIKNGQVVRLLRGEFDKVTEYSQNPVTVAEKWQDAGAEWLHLIDLDGAKDGHIKNIDVIKRIVNHLSIPVQVGGGVRTEEHIQTLLDAGVSRVILGTKVIQDIDFLKRIVQKWGNKIVVSLDCNKGFIATHGWTETTEIKATDFVKTLEEMGVSLVVYTDIATDGMLTGPNFEELKELLKVTHIPIIASGGIASIDDIKKLATLEESGIMGAITGKALYEGHLDLAEAISIC